MGVLVAGVVVELVGPDLALLSIGACYLLVALVPLLAWPRRSIDLESRERAGPIEDRERLVTR